VAVVCHGGIVRAILALLLRLPLSKTAHFGCDYGSLTVVTTHPGKHHGSEIDLLNFQPLREEPI
jgi:broad specificity phosphatase PhoE